MTDQEFILYLKVIRDQCTDHYWCDACDYYTKFGCAFKYIPADWKMEELEKGFDEGSGNDETTN